MLPITCVASRRVLSVLSCHSVSFIFFFFNDTATTEIYTLSLHDALPILPPCASSRSRVLGRGRTFAAGRTPPRCRTGGRSEEHTSELQSHHDLVCRLLLEKKKKKIKKQQK